MGHPGQLPISAALSAYAKLNNTKVAVYSGDSVPLIYGEGVMEKECYLQCLEGIHYNLSSSKKSSGVAIVSQMEPLPALVTPEISYSKYSNFVPHQLLDERRRLKICFYRTIQL